jgi:hypothetical protein
VLNIGPRRLVFVGSLRMFKDTFKHFEGQHVTLTQYIERCFNDDMRCLQERPASPRLLIILRGLPGSGKSTIAKRLCESISGAVVCSADDYFTKDGVYAFNPMEVPEAHNTCRNLAEHRMAQGYPAVIIDNTNTRLAHMEPYLLLAKKYGYQVVIKPVGGMRPENVEPYHKRQTHRVPISTMIRLANEYQK